MKKALWTLLLLGASSAIKGLQANQGGHMELTRLRMSLMYVRSIRTFRLLFMSLWSMGVCLIFLLVGLVLFHVSLFLYAPWSMATKMEVGILFSAAYLMATLVLFSRIFSSEEWLRIFHADTIMDRLHKKTIPKDSIKDAPQR